MSRWPLFALAALPLVLTYFRPAPPSPLVWWTTHSLEKIRPFDPEPEGATHAVKIQAARNEFEPFQVVLRAEGQDIDSVDLEVTDLRAKTGIVSSQSYISVYLEHYLNLKAPSSVAGGTGEWPDPLIPRVDRYANEKRNAFPFKLIRGRNQPVWIEVFVPPSVRAGVYSGQVRVLVAGKVQLSVPLDLEVWDFQLPSTSSLATTFGFSGNSADSAHYGSYTKDADIDDLTYLYAKAALLHRITLNGSAGILPLVSTANSKVEVHWDRYDHVNQPFLDGQVFSPGEPLYGARATSVGIPTPPLARTPEQQTEFWRKAAAHFREKGWFDRFFNYLWDEPKPKDFAAMVELGKAVHRADPGLKSLVTAPLHPEWSDFIGIWTPPINCFERKPNRQSVCAPIVERTTYDSELANGKQLWWYQSCMSHGCDIVGGDYFRGWPSYMIDDAPVRNRIMEWLTWKYGIQGELYFNTTEAFSEKQDPWKDVRLFGGNGDGTLFYPGRPGVIGGTKHIPVESIRLKLIREGLEDYEYLALLTKIAGYKATADIVSGFIRNTYDYDQDPRGLYTARASIAREITSRQ